MANQPKKESNRTIILSILGALILVLLIVYYSVFAQTDVGKKELSNSQTIMLFITYLFLAIAAGLIVYFIIASKTNKNRCPKCKMKDDFIIVREKVMSHDSKLVTKKVQKKIRDTSGQVLKTTEEIRHVTVVDTVSHQQRKCKNCYHMWDVTIKKHIEIK